MDTYLDTKRLALRRFTADDADLLIELDSDPAVMRYLTGGEPTTPDDVRARDLPGVLRGYERWRGDVGLFGAQDKDSGAFVGWFSLRPEPGAPLDEVELGYRLRRAECGKGYATEGSRALLDKAFTELDVRIVWGEPMSVNEGSRKVMEAVGMTVMHTLDTPPDMLMIEGSEHGGLRYEITKAQWEQR